ncbi:hypothetical protein B0H12DRAFT_1132670 [Mycena haematopus]|nr:hypothetical protein B0H12DRAFT_1132670 [Mycena haematopus]
MCRRTRCVAGWRESTGERKRWLGLSFFVCIFNFPCFVRPYPCRDTCPIPFRCYFRSLSFNYKSYLPMTTTL